MTPVTYRAVYLRDQGGHVFAVDPGDGRCAYITVPPKVEDVSVGLGAQTKARSQPTTLEFGDKVNITIAEAE